jgi:hypothetical protein
MTVHLAGFCARVSASPVMSPRAGRKPRPQNQTTSRDGTD